MSSLVVKSRELEEFCDQFVIGVVDSKLLVASDLLLSYQPEDVTNSHGQLRVLSRTFCGADEFQVLAAIPFFSFSGCSAHSGNCHEFSSCKAVYTLDPSNQFIWAFAYGIYKNEQSPRQWMFRISSISGEYTHFEIDQLKTAGSVPWEVCTGCRASKLQFVSEDTCVQLVLHDSTLVGWECSENSWNDFYHHSDHFHFIAISVNLESHSFDMTCSKHKFPSRCESFDYSIQSMDNSFSEWCWIVNDILVVYNIDTQRSHAFLPKNKAAKRMRKATSHNLKLVRQSKGLQLVMEPRFTLSKEDAFFYIYDIVFYPLAKAFGLRKVKQSNSVPKSVAKIDQDRCIQQSVAHLHNGILYKFYANYCLTTFLRMPTLQEAAFVGLQKLWISEEDGVLFGGISPLQLNQELNINAYMMDACRRLTTLFSVVYVTVPTIEVGKKIAREAVQSKLAACVNIIPQVTSIYEWDDKLVEDSEFMLIIKTKTEKMELLKEMVLKSHPYDVPEFISLPIEQGSEPYLKWIEKKVGEPNPSSSEKKEKNVDNSSSVGSD